MSYGMVAVHAAKVAGIKKLSSVKTWTTSFTIIPIAFLLILIAGLPSCNKNEPSQPVKKPTAELVILENVGDTLLPADTCYKQRLVAFQCTPTLLNPQWTIGTSTYAGVQAVNLVFNETDKIDVTVKGNFRNGMDTSILKSLTIVSPREFISPLVGEYLGSNIDLKADTFRVRINYWFGPRYPWWSEGAYSISNVPNRYADTTQNFNGYVRPEITGIIGSTGYKNMAFNKSGYLPAAGVKGYASLKRGAKDTLVVNYTILDTASLRQSNLISYISKSFIGVRQ